MRLRGRLLSEVTAEDVLALKADEVSESLHLEYKAALPQRAEEFLKDATAFANTDYGVILFGVSEKRMGNQKTGVPDRICGIGDVALDDEKRRLETMMRDTDPPVTGCLIRDIVLPNGERVIAIGVRKSPLAPHGVKMGGGWTYWRRAETGNFAVSTRELRQMFLERDEWWQEAEVFRQDRIANNGMERRPALNINRLFYLHVLPLGRIRETVNIVAHQETLFHLNCVNGVGWNHRPNLDGYVLYGDHEGVCTSYVQWFRFGGCELCSSEFHYLHQDGRTGELDAARLSAASVSHTRTAMRFMEEHLGLGPPLAVMLSILAVQGASIYTKGWERSLPLGRLKHNEIEAPRLILPPAVIDDPEVEVKDLLMPTFDIIWQAAGVEESFLRKATLPWG